MQIKHLSKELKNVHFEELISETFLLMVMTILLVLMVNGTESHEKNLMSWEILIRSIVAQIFMMLVLINMVSNVRGQ